MSEGQSQPFFPNGQGWENWDDEHDQQENQDNNANQQDDNVHQRSSGSKRQSGLRSQEKMFAGRNPGYSHHNRPYDRNSSGTDFSNKRPNRYNPSGLFTWNRNGSNASSTSHPRDSNDWRSHKSPNNNHGQHSHSQRDEQDGQDIYTLNRKSQYDIQNSNQTDDSITLDYGTEDSTLTSPAQPIQSHSDPGVSPTSFNATSSTPLPQKPTINHPSTFDTPPQPSGGNVNDTNLYAELDGDDDGGHKQSRWTNMNAQKTPKETIIDLVNESSPSRNNAGEIPTTSEYGGIAGLAKALIEAGETRPTIPNDSPLQEIGTSLPSSKKKQTNRKKANKRKVSPGIRRSARKTSSTSRNILSQSEPTEEGTIEELQVSEEPEFQIFEPPISNISIKKRKVKVIITLKYSKKNLIDSQEEEEEEDIIHESSMEATESENDQSTVGDEDEISEAEMEIEDPVITDGDESIFTFNGKKYLHQTLACKDIRLRRGIPKCRPCTANEDVPCLFQYTRAMPLCKNGEFKYCLWNRCIFRPLQISVKEACLPDQNDFNRPMDSTTCMHMQLVCAKSLLPIFKKALQHSLQKEIVIRPREIQFRHYCDFCSTGLFASSYLCRKCGQEYCFPCQQKMIKGQNNPNHHHQESNILRCAVNTPLKDRYLHSPEDMLPVTRFSSEELKVEIKAMEDILHAVRSEEFPQISRELSIIGEMEDLMESDSSDLSDRESSPATTEAFSEPQSGISEAMSEDCRVQTLIPFHEVARFQNDRMNEEEFVNVWSQGIPLVVSNVAPRLTWDPNAFQERYGDMECTVIRNDETVNDQTKVDENVNYSKRLTVHDFF
ncbi:hypothetical protein L7F22_019145 [Adiantum nelumboides]|nr:hypothetical protein [Adiantum nelumboides]